MRKTIALVGAAFCGLVLFAESTIWYVDDDQYGKGGDGSAAAPFGTIQDAVDAAAAGDTISVAEGTYGQGGKNYEYGPGTNGFNRVFIDKSLTIVGAGRGKTVIVGAFDPTSGTCGSGAVRCLMCDPKVTDVRVEGVTLKGGATHLTEKASARIITSGGGIYAYSRDNRCYLVDSAIVDSVGVRGGGAYGVILIRSAVVGCKALSMGAAAHTCGFWASIIVGNTSTSCTVDSSILVQSTVAGNADVTYGVYETAGVLNSLCVATTANNLGQPTSGYVKNSVIGDQKEAFSAKTLEALVDCATNVDNFAQILSPATGDFRIVAGSEAATAGSSDLIASFTAFTVPEADRYLDFNKKTIPSTGVIPAGAVQETATAASGRYVVATESALELFGGHVVPKSLWVCTDAYPAQLRLTNIDSDKPVYAWNVTATASAANYRPPEMDGSVVLTMPPVGITATGQVLFAQAELYVDPKNGKDDDAAYDGSSWAKAFKSAIKAGNSVTKARTIIHCAAGDYDEASQGSIVANGHNARISRTSATGYAVYYKGAGVGKSIIYGKSDPDAAAAENGCGPNACRCVYLPGSGDIVQGFTLTGGHSSKRSEDVTGRDGGNILVASNASVVDCLVTNGVARRGGAINGAPYVARCEFIDNDSYNGTFRGGMRLVSCFFLRCKTDVGTHLYNDPSGIANSTLYHGLDGVSRGSSNFLEQKYLVNSIYVGTETLVSSKSTAVGGEGNVYKSSGNYNREGLTRLDPANVSTEAPDLYCFTEAPQYGAKPTAENFGSNWWTYAATDLDGKFLQFDADGKVRPGCRMSLTSAALVTKPAYGSTTAALTNSIAAGEKLTVTYANGAKPRPFLGIVVNGVTNEATSVDLTASTEVDGKLYNVSFLANGTNWYVNAAAEDDSGDGFTPATAKKTLKGIFGDSYVLSDDVVHAAKGEYKEGAMCSVSGFTGAVSNRVEIGEGMTLVSDEGAAKTFIVGADSPETGSNTDSYKRGPGAIKCAYLAKNAVLKGFTLTGGRSASAAMSGTTYPNGNDYEGGGARCADTTARIFDSVITNCAAIRSGGVRSGTLVNCRIVQNIGTGGNLGSGGEGNAFVGCYLGKQVNDSSTFREPKQIDNCTLDGIAISYYPPSLGVRNTLFINMTTSSGTFAAASSGHLPTLSNCVFDEASWKNVHDVKYKDGTWSNCSSNSTEKLMIGTYGRPLKGSPLIDAADETLAAGYTQKLTETDAEGSQRVYDAHLDIGAFEYDWRGDFAAAIDPAAQVTVASPNVTIDAATKKVKIPDGENVSVTFAGVQGCKATVTVKAVTDGTLAVSRAGEPLATVTAAEGAKGVRYVSSGSDALDFTFAGTGYGLIDAFLGKTPAAFYLQ